MQHLQLDAVQWKAPVEGFKGRFVHSENMTFAHWDIEAGALLPKHAHLHEQITYVMQGELELTVDGETNTLGPGSVVIIPSNVSHGGKSITNSRIIDVFCPVREDYR